MNRRQPSRTELFEMVRQCLLRDWDPIGVREYSGVQDEYDSYVSGICSLLLDGADAYKLRRYLTQAEKVSMGLSTTSTHLDDVAQKLLAMVGR